MKQRVFSHLGARWPLLLLVTLLAALLATRRPAPAERSRAGLASLLGIATHSLVDPEQLVWEPSGGVIADLWYGRGLYFVAGKAKGAPRDVFHARVRVSSSGTPLQVVRARNLTQTSLGDDTGLRGLGSRIVYSTITYGLVQAVTVLGSMRVDVVLAEPVPALTLELGPDLLRMRLPDAKQLVLDLQTHQLRPEPGQDPEWANVVVQQRAAPSLSSWAADMAREGLGARAASLLEGALFAAKDRVKRGAYDLAGAPRALPEVPRSRPSDASVHWPPEAIASIWPNPPLGEGQWTASTPAWLPISNEQAPKYFFRSFLRPDRSRPYAELVLVAMDMRQLELRMQAGYQTPKPVTGPPGSGRLPPGEDRNLVAVFNGAFESAQGGNGMMAEGRVLVPPVPAAASVVIAQNGDALFGTWPSSSDIPSQVSAFRQSLKPLLVGAQIDPDVLADGSVPTERSALCLTDAGHLYYAWGKELALEALAGGLQQAGCDYALQLDAGAKSGGFAFARMRGASSAQQELELLHPGMDMDAARHLAHSAQDYFYLTAYQPTPAASAGESWVPSAGLQPEPRWLAAIFETQVQLGTLRVQLTSFERGRLAFSLRAGSREPVLAGYRPPKLELDRAEQARALVALNLGHATVGTDYGMAFSGNASLPLRTDRATLIISEQGVLRLVGPTPDLQIGATDAAVQLPLLIEAGKVSSSVDSRGSRMQRAGLCLLGNGRLLLAQTENDSSDILALALIARGCRLAVELDRGSHHAAFSHRAGSDRPPQLGYETSVLYGLDRPMQTHASRWLP